MAGLAISLRTDGRQGAFRLARQMTGAMHFPGPEGISRWSDGSVALGHCRLNVTAESRHGNQPCSSDDGKLAVVLDGYLTHWKELRRELLARGA